MTVRLEKANASAAAAATAMKSHGLLTQAKEGRPDVPLARRDSPFGLTCCRIEPRWAAAFWMMRAHRLSPARFARFFWTWTNCRRRKLCSGRSRGRCFRTDRLRSRAGSSARSTRRVGSRGARGRSLLLQRTPFERARAATGGSGALADVLALEDGDHSHSYHHIDICGPPYYNEAPVGGERSPVSDRSETVRARRRLFIFASLLGVIALALIVQLVRLTIVLPSREGGETARAPRGPAGKHPRPAGQDPRRHHADAARLRLDPVGDERGGDGLRARAGSWEWTRRRSWTRSDGATATP